MYVWDFARWDFVRLGFCRLGFCPLGFCPLRFCPLGFCPALIHILTGVQVFKSQEAKGRRHLYKKNMYIIHL